MMPVGQLQYFQSKVDGKLHPCAVCATDTNDEPKPFCRRTTCSYTAATVLTPFYRNLKVSYRLLLTTIQFICLINHTRQMERRFSPYFLIPQIQSTMSQCTPESHRMQYAGEAISICNSCPITLSIPEENSSTGGSGEMNGNPSDSQLLKQHPRFARVGYIHNLSHCSSYQLRPIFRELICPPTVRSN